MAKPDDQIEDENLNEEDVQDDQLQEDDSQEDLQDDGNQEDEEEQQEEDEQDEPEEEPEEEEPKEEKPSRREQLRIQDLLKKYGTPTQEPERTDDDGPNFRDLVDADDDTLKDLDKTSKEYGAKQYNQGLETAKYLNWNTNLKIETPIVHQKHPQMADERIRNSINAEYLNLVGYDEKKQNVKRPDISYEEFVDARFEQATAIAEALTEKTRKTIRRQASRTAVRPDGSSARRLDMNKAPQDMSDEELDAFLSRSGFGPKTK